MTIREIAIAICVKASECPEQSRKAYEDTAAELGFEDDSDTADAVEMAALAWCRVDPEPLGIDSPHDPRRDAAAAEALRGQSE